jgi:hypothetical protein
MEKNRKKEYEGTVLQISFNGNEWKTKFSTIAGNVLPIYNYFFDFDNSNGFLSNFKKINLWFSFGTLLFFGYVLYKQFYIFNRDKKIVIYILILGFC